MGLQFVARSKGRPLFYEIAIPGVFETTYYYRSKTPGFNFNTVEAQVIAVSIVTGKQALSPKLPQMMVGVFVYKLPNLLRRHFSKKPVHQVWGLIVSIFFSKLNPFLFLG